MINLTINLDKVIDFIINGIILTEIDITISFFGISL